MSSYRIIHNSSKILSRVSAHGLPETAAAEMGYRFPGKPDDDTRQLLKGHGFRWSPTRKAWVRMLNGRGRYAAMRVREKLDA